MINDSDPGVVSSLNRLTGTFGSKGSTDYFHDQGPKPLFVDQAVSNSLMFLSDLPRNPRRPTSRDRSAVEPFILLIQGSIDDDTGLPDAQALM